MTDDNTVQLNTQIQIEAKKLRHHQYDRMQDVTVTYGTLALKAMATISGGALVAIGAAFALVCWGLAQLALAFEHNSFAAKV